MRNVEIKAWARDWAAQSRAAAEMADRKEQLQQTDVFFRAPSGRLKLRGQGPDGNFLIAYQRPDQKEAALSDYCLIPVEDFEAARKSLAAVLGEEKVVEKRRTVYHWRQARLHFDEVEGLGRFIEIEVVLRPDQDEAFGQEAADYITKKLEIRPEDLIDVAYADLL